MLRVDKLHIITEALRAAEMRQGCTNHTWYAEKLLEQIEDGVIFNLHQKELAKWQQLNFGQPNIKDMALGMAEEVGELCHVILKRDQGIRSYNERSDDLIADAFADAVIFGIQLMSCMGKDAEKVITDTIALVIKRDWVNNPQGDGETQPVFSDLRADIIGMQDLTKD